jgi:enediyne biosynthesis protein E4
MLLRNDGTGHFTDVTATMAPELAEVGMVTDAVWRDVDGDGHLDLVVVGEWMPITIFKNIGAGKLKPLVAPGLERSNGWWNRIVAADLDGDGRLDFVVGNLGLNGRLRAGVGRPTTMYVKDFNGNGSLEQILSCYNDSVSYPLPMRDQLIKSIPYLKARFLKYSDYARATTKDLFTPDELSGAVEKKAYTFATSLVHSNKDGSYSVMPLPEEAQLAPVYGIVARDIDHDGHIDLLLAGNFYGFKPEIGRMSSSNGLFLRGLGKGRFTPLRAAESGFMVPGQTRDIQRIRTARGEAYVVARNNDRPLVFRQLTSDSGRLAVGTAAGSRKQRQTATGSRQ